MPTPYRLLLITTGGTIAGITAAYPHDAAEIRSGEDFVHLSMQTIKHLNARYNLEISIDIYNLCNIDSSDMTPAFWSRLAKLITEKFDDFDSFIITHGTNTMGYTCSALSFALANPSKPIIVTGSQVPAGLPGSDGWTNLQNSIRLTVMNSELTHVSIKGVLAVFGNHILPGTRVTKDTDFEYDAFKPRTSYSLGRIGRTISIDELAVQKHNSYLQSARYPEARLAKELVCDSDFDMRIVSIIEIPGLSSDIFSTIVENNDVQGIVLSAFGAGDPSACHIPAFQRLKERRIPVVITTQAYNGLSNCRVNYPGIRLMEAGLAIPTYDMNIESITTKLGWLLAKKRRGEMAYSQFHQEFVSDLRGEMTVLWETNV